MIRLNLIRAVVLLALGIAVLAPTVGCGCNNPLNDIENQRKNMREDDKHAGDPDYVPRDKRQ